MKLADLLLSFQFTPSFLKFITLSPGVLAIGFLIVVILTALFGRIYCAALCPLGILQDIIFRLSRKLRKKQRPQYQKPYPKIQFAVFAVTLISAVLGSFALLNTLDPYSFFGRIASNLFEPVLIFANNLVIPLLEKFEIYAHSTLTIHHISASVLIFNLLALFILAAMVVLRGRLYCNTLCPVGTILSVFAKHSLIKIQIDNPKCTSCKKCERICRAGCIDIAERKVDSGRCVACFDCIDICPTKAVEYKFSSAGPAAQSGDPRRRRFLRYALYGTGVLTLASIPLRKKTRRKLLTGRSQPVMPPGATDIDHFTATCTACHLCVSNCPTNVIRPAIAEYGLAGLLQPTLNFDNSYCDYDCNICTQLCPTGALQPLMLEAKQLTQIGTCKLVPKKCIVYRTCEDCGACIEVCPTHAVYAIERNGIYFPKTNPDICIGCGFCEKVCPARPRAITVEGSAIQIAAQAPYSNQAPVRKQDAQPTLEEFPF